MKKWKIIAPLMLVVLFAGAGLWLMGAGIRTTNEPAVAEAAVEPDQGTGGTEAPEDLEPGNLEEVLTQFANMIYTYDTRERSFYDGAQSFMTEQGYQMLVPMSAGEEAVEEDSHLVAVVSALKEVTFYYQYLSENEALIMMEANFSLSRGGNGSIWQYTKLSVLATQTGWKIDGYEPIDTIER